MRRLVTILGLLLACAGTVRAVEPWRDPAFAKRIKVVLQAANIDGDESDFGALLTVTGADEAHGQIASGDITEDKWVIYDGAGNKLPWDKESYTDDGGGGNALFSIWVKTDIYTVPAGDQNAAWFYYDNSATSANTSTDVWNAAFEGVWHLSDASPFDDSTTNVRHATDDADDPSAQYATGLIHYSRTWPGPDGGATLASSITLEASNCTIESWVRMTSTSVWRAIFGDTGNDKALYLHTGDGKLHVYSDAGNTGSAGAVTLNQWDHIALVYDGSDTLFYINGALDTTASSFDGRNDVYFLAVDEIDNEGFIGQTDEMRASSTNRSTAWLKFTYHNVHETDHEQTWSAAESQPVAGIPMHLHMRSPHLDGGHLQ